MWKAVHIYYYDDDKEKLLLDGIRPMIRELQASFGLSRWYLRRHWKRGPHIGLFLDVEEKLFEQSIFPLIHEKITAFLERYPSQKRMDAEEYAKLSKTLGAWELEPGPYMPLYGDNTVHIQPYETKEEVLNGVNVVCLIEDFKVNVADLLLDVLQECRNDQEKKLQRIIQMMVVVAELYPRDGIVRGHLSYRSHVEGYLHNFDQSGSILRAFQEKDQALGKQVDEWVRSVTENIDEQGIYQGEDAFLSNWSNILYRLRQDAFDMATAGEIDSNTDHYKEVAAAISQEAMERWNVDNNFERLSPFHQHLQSRKEGLEVLNSPEFHAYRILVNNFYNFLPLFQINPNTKHLLCYLVANAVERVKGVTWQELMGYGGFTKDGNK